MTSAWVSAVRRAAASHLDELGDRLDRTLAGTDLGAARLPLWTRPVQVLQWLLLLVTLGGIAWTAALAGLGRLQSADTPQVAGAPVPALVAGGGIVLGLVIAVVARIFAARTARRRAARADERLREGVNVITHELVIDPVERELAAYAAVRNGVDRALA